MLPQNEAGASSARTFGELSRAAGRPYIGRTLFLGKEGLARPTQEMNPASWFLRATPLLSGRARPTKGLIFKTRLPKME